MPASTPEPEFPHAAQWLQQTVCFLLLLMLSAVADAALIEEVVAGYGTTAPSGAVCCTSYYQARIGDNTVGPVTDNVVGAPWEMRSRLDGVDTYSQRTYSNGISESFTLTHNAALGRLTFTLGSDVYEMDFADNTGWETIGLEIKIRDPDTKPRTLTLDNLYFQSAGVADTALSNDSFFVSNSGAPGVERQTALYIQDDSTVYLGDFTLSGNMTFAWSGEEAEAGDLRFRIGADGQVTGVPIPAAVWLFGSGLIGLIAFAKRRK